MVRKSKKRQVRRHLANYTKTHAELSVDAYYALVAAWESRRIRTGAEWVNE